MDVGYAVIEKRRPIRSKKILAAAKGEDCAWPACGLCDGTVVAAHSNELSDGKGMRQKADDFYVAFLCGHHHDFYDGRIASKNSTINKQEYFNIAMKKTWRRLWDRGIIGEK